MTSIVRSQYLPKPNDRAGQIRAGQKERMFAARARLEQREQRRVSLDELGARVADAMGKPAPFANTVVRRWIEGIGEPENVITWVALAEVFDVNVGWLAFAEGAPARVNDVSPEELARLAGVRVEYGEDARVATEREIAEARRRAAGEDPRRPANVEPQRSRRGAAQRKPPKGRR
jgi:hypothetical protein